MTLHWHFGSLAVIISFLYLLFLALNFSFFSKGKEINVNQMSGTRTILKSFYAAEQGEGAGAVVRRSIGVSQMRNFTPFLMLDHFNVSKGAGFPDHPHRGQETITLLMKGFMLHEDFTGASGILRPGDLQFMTAGKGAMHSEMPYSPDGQNVEGLQLWVDLPRKLKYSEPRYRDLRKEEIPIIKPNEKVTVNVISGKSYGTESIKDLAYTPVVYYDFTVKAGGVFEQEVPEDFNAFIYLLDGNLEVNGESAQKFNVIFFNRDGKAIKGSVPEGSDDAHFVLIAGKVLDQPVVQYGPFVVCSKDEVYQTFEDYQEAKNGFERSKNWHSKIGEGVTKEIFDDLIGKVGTPGKK